jgi:hypothetical protein
MLQPVDPRRQVGAAHAPDRAAASVGFGVHAPDPAATTPSRTLDDGGKAQPRYRFGIGAGFEQPRNEGHELTLSDFCFFFLAFRLSTPCRGGSLGEVGSDPQFLLSAFRISDFSLCPICHLLISVFSFSAFSLHAFSFALSCLPICLFEELVWNQNMNVN